MITVAHYGVVLECQTVHSAGEREMEPTGAQFAPLVGGELVNPSSKKFDVCPIVLQSIAVYIIHMTTD